MIKFNTINIKAIKLKINTTFFNKYIINNKIQ